MSLRADREEAALRLPNYFMSKILRIGESRHTAPKGRRGQLYGTLVGSRLEVFSAQPAHTAHALVESQHVSPPWWCLTLDPCVTEVVNLNSAS